MGGDRWVEQRGGFERVFMSEIGAEQKLPFLGNLLVGEQGSLDALETGLEQIARLLVALIEFAQNFSQQLMHFLLWQGSDPSANIDGSLLGREPKRPHPHARPVGIPSNARAFHVDCFHFEPWLDLAARFISRHRPDLGILNRFHFATLTSALSS